MPKQKKSPVIALIGAGSRSFGFSMCMDICQTPALKGAEVRIERWDRDLREAKAYLDDILVAQKDLLPQFE